MESTIYPQSPLAEYLEGQGEASQDWQTAEKDPKSESSDTSSFAPKSPPKPLRTSIQKLLSPLRIKGHRRTRTWKRLHDVCSSAMNARVSTPENDRFLDQFRYSIIASQLLTYEAQPSAETEVAHTLGDHAVELHHTTDSFSLQGAAVSATISFLTAWTLHWARAPSPESATHWLNICVILALLVFVAIMIYGYARRKSVQRVREAAVEALSDLIIQSHALDKVSRSAIGLIQEIEIVSRGYDISNPLPPISRLELKGSARRCISLRSGLADAVSSTTCRYLEAHDTMLPFVDTINMQRYHDIYDLSRQDYQEMIQNLPSSLEEDPGSLRAMRTSLTRLFVARQIFLCDLLALPSESSAPDLGRWSVTSDEIDNVSGVIRASATIIGHLTNDEDNRSWGGQLKPQSRESTQHDENQAVEILAPRTPGKQKLQAQLRRLDALSQSIRGLNARTSLLRDEANDLIERDGQSPDVGSLLARQYDIIGSELKSLTSEWDRGRNTMLSGPGAVDLLSPSRSCSGLRSPQSSVYSLGGTTAVSEGSPATALKRLSGQSSLALSNDGLGSDEELFEAVSLPPKLKRMSMAREEMLAKMQEDRRKRATLQESRDATTSMLRELETVIKHRPRGRTTSRIPGM